MKVFEKDTDRKAEFHVSVEGSTTMLDEYHEDFDADNAVSCYVPVAEGQKLRLNGRFDGTTRHIHMDVLIDGILRHSKSIEAESAMKNKKLNCGNFLVLTKEGILDAPAEVTKLAEIEEDDEVDRSASVGTIEVRLSALRRLEESHALQDVEAYWQILEDGYEAADDDANKTKISPQFRLSYNKNCPVLERRKAMRHQKAAGEKRPGKEPWAVFRFHYRRLESITDEGMRLTYSSNGRPHKSKELGRELKIETIPVSELPAKSPEKDKKVTTTSGSSPTKKEKRASVDTRETSSPAQSNEDPNAASEWIEKVMATPTLEPTEGTVSAPTSPISAQFTTPTPALMPAAAINPVKRPAPVEPSSASNKRSKANLSIDVQIQETLKRIKQARASREAIKDRQSAIDRRLEPYQRRMQEQLDKLQKEVEAEEAAHLEDESRLQHSMDMLRELEEEEEN